jgi:hypothetical protein
MVGLMVKVNKTSFISIGNSKLSFIFLSDTLAEPWQETIHSCSCSIRGSIAYCCVAMLRAKEIRVKALLLLLR